MNQVFSVTLFDQNENNFKYHASQSLRESGLFRQLDKILRFEDGLKTSQSLRESGLFRPASLELSMSEQRISLNPFVNQVFSVLLGVGSKGTLYILVSIPS